MAPRPQRKLFQEKRSADFALIKNLLSIIKTLKRLKILFLSEVKLSRVE